MILALSVFVARTTGGWVFAIGAIRQPDPQATSHKIDGATDTSIGSWVGICAVVGLARSSGRRSRSVAAADAVLRADSRIAEARADSDD